MIHLTKKDFKIDWYSRSGAGGQHRNKHQNCCRITHLATGLCEKGTRVVVGLRTNVVHSQSWLRELWIFFLRNKSLRKLL